MWHQLEKGMETSQIIIYSVLAILIFLYVRRMFFLRSLIHYTPAEVAAKLTNDSIMLLDVRTASERQRNSIRNSLHIPLHELRKRTNELEKYRNREVVCYCASGSRSGSAAATLHKLGFKAANMKGGIAEWNFSGLK
jgi:rhodanese-related sulfurtransferase